MITLAVTGALDSHRGRVFFSVGPDGQRGPDCPDVFFSVSAQISWLLWGFLLLPPEFWPSARRGPENPKGAQWHTLSAPPPGYVPDQTSKSGRMSTPPRQPEFRNRAMVSGCAAWHRWEAAQPTTPGMSRPTNAESHPIRPGCDTYTLVLPLISAPDCTDIRSLMYGTTASLFFAQLFGQLFHNFSENFRSRSPKVRSPGQVKWPHLRKTFQSRHGPRFVGRSWNAQKKRQMPFDSWWCADSKNVIFIQIGRWPFSKIALLCPTRYFFSLAIWQSHLFTRRQAFSSPTG